MQENSPWMGVFLLPASASGAWGKKQHLQVERGYFMVCFHTCGCLHLQSQTCRICAAFLSGDSCSSFALAYQVTVIKKLLSPKIVSLSGISGIM